jgi:hypothetical protein
MPIMRIITLLVMMVSVLVIVSCNPDFTSVEHGQTVSGELTKSDSCWKDCSIPPPGQTPTCTVVCIDRYQIVLGSGISYTVSFNSNPDIEFEDLEGGTFTVNNVSQGHSFAASYGSATWVPIKSGTNVIGVFGQYDSLPATYTFRITP